MKPYHTYGMLFAVKVYRFIDNKFFLMMQAAFFVRNSNPTNCSIGCIEKRGGQDDDNQFKCSPLGTST